MKHLDLFSGVGGFAIAVDTVFGKSEHIFCDIDPYCQAVLKKHWPTSKIHGDIRTLTPHAVSFGHVHGEPKKLPAVPKLKAQRKPLTSVSTPPISILTGGFPCQPFSNAGRRKGTEDDRHLWPEMLRVIREFSPEWVIGENVGGFVTWGGGVVLDEVCTDLEAAGYEVWPVIIPAVAVNAPHRRDRVWIVANRRSKRREEGFRKEVQPKIKVSIREKHNNNSCQETWNTPWYEVAAQFCSVDDGLPGELGGVTLTPSRHRKEQLKAYGNAIVPKVAEQILRFIYEAQVSRYKI